jgi:four helix bundle protein
MRPERVGFLQAAEELAAEIDGLLPLVQVDAAHAADNLGRSAESVLFNTGEGVGAFRPRVKIAAYDIAKKEANEVRVILRRLVRRNLLTQQQVNRAYNLAGSVIGMLTAACITLQKRV